MKIPAYRLLITAIILHLLVFTDVSGQSIYKAEKEIKKTYSLNKITELGVDNAYGNIHIETWDKNQIDVLITIKVEKRSQSQAQQMVDEVDVSISGSENTGSIRFTSRMNRNMHNRRNESFRIDYDIQIPKNSPIDIRNKYGNLYLSDLNATADVKVSYGKVRINEINGKANFDLAYGGGEIEKLSNGFIDIKYSNLYIAEAQDIDIDCQYSNIEFGKLRELELSDKYGNIEIDEITSLKGHIKYAGIRIETLKKSIDMEASYGDGIKIRRISKGFDFVKIDSDYVTTQLTFERGSSAKVNAYTKYGKLKYPNEYFDFSHVNTANNSSDYKGKMGNESATVGDISLTSSYGSIILDVR